jgi:hypothetical protein
MLASEMRDHEATGMEGGGSQESSAEDRDPAYVSQFHVPLSLDNERQKGD